MTTSEDGKRAELGTLVLVGTPIGNREDLSPRARKTILSADVLLCEDTRSPLRLLGTQELPPRLSCFVGNEGKRVGIMLDHLAAGRTVVYVSEAGMPTWSDPGMELVRAALGAGFPVDVVPGPTASACAVALSGFVAQQVLFVGFLPRSGTARTDSLQHVSQQSALVVGYEAGNRVPALLRDLALTLPDAHVRQMVVARELTKLHQECMRGTVNDLSQSVTAALRGEVTWVLDGGPPASERDAEGIADVRAVAEVLLDPDLRPREKAKRVAALTGLEADDVYRRLVASKRSPP